MFIIYYTIVLECLFISRTGWEESGNETLNDDELFLWYDRRKVFGLIWHCQRTSSSRISDTPVAGFKVAQNLSSGFVEWSCVVVITSIIPFPLEIIQKLWFSRKKCRNELSLMSFTFRGNGLVTVTIFSTIFLYRQILNLVVYFLCDY